MTKNAYECISRKTEQLCEQAFNLAKQKPTDHAGFTRLNIKFMREHKRHMTDVSVIERADKTIDHLKKILTEHSGQNG